MVRLSEQMAAARTRRGGGSWGEDPNEAVVDRIQEEYGPEKSNNPNDVAYTGGTPTQAYAYQHPVEKAAGKALPAAIGMSLPTFLPPIFDKGGMFGPDEDKPEGNVSTRFADETSELIEATVYKGMEAVDWVWSNTVARTASTVAITAADVLDGGEFKATPSDTWNRASSVSYGQAYTQAGVATLTSLQSIFGVDATGLLEDWNVDLWSDADIARAQQQVYAYSTVTGVVDTALNLLPIPASKGVGAASRAAGLSKTMSRGQFKRVYDGGMRGIEARQPEGAPIVVEGSENVRQSGRRITDEWDVPPDRVDDPSREGRPLRGNELADEAIRIAATDDVIRIMESPLVQGQVAQGRGKVMAKIAQIGTLTGDVLLFGGPYSNLHATQALFAGTVHMPRKNRICTGDMVAYCADPVATSKLVLDQTARIIAGNCEVQLVARADDCG